MATDVLAPGAEEPDDHGPEAEPRAHKHSFFAVYKKGQGYWTRMGTALGAILLITVCAVFVYRASQPYLTAHPAAPALLTAAITLITAVLAWRLMNKPRNVDFLIATDVEMKKVNWTTRRELIGSTKIVIIFMFMIALILFLIDVGTGLFFQLIGLLKFGPLS